MTTRKYLKILFPLVALLGLSGCLSSTSNYYVLSVASQPSVVYPNAHKVIGVEKVTVPGYLYKRDIAIAKSSSQITLLGNAQWGEDLDGGLTNRLIGFLQKKFNQPDVYAYPWGIDKQPNIKVSVQISRFIAQGEYVYLDANWNVGKVGSTKYTAQLFSTKVATGSDVSVIVSSMDKAFGLLEEEIAKGIHNF